MKNKILIKIILSLILIVTTSSCAMLGVGEYGWKKATPRIQAAMVTPLLVMKNNDNVKKQAKQIREAKHFNSIVSLVDLQSGRSYIYPGRDATRINQRTKKNIETVLDQGVTPILIVRNDWAARTGSGCIPSVGCQVGNRGFYSSSILEKEKVFLSSLNRYFPYIHIQLNIEPSRRESARFALEMARHLRAIGFKNKIIVNPAYEAINEHERIRRDLEAVGVVWARSRHGSNFGGDPIISTDGNGHINQHNFKGEWLPKLKADGREYIVWSRELAGSPHKIPNGYIK